MSHHFLETHTFPAAVFSNDGSSATSWLKRPLVESSVCEACSFTAGKSAPKKRELKSGPSASQLILLQVVQLHVAQVDVVFHGKLAILAVPRLPGADGRERPASTGAVDPRPKDSSLRNSLMPCSLKDPFSRANFILRALMAAMAG